MQSTRSHVRWNGPFLRFALAVGGGGWLAALGSGCGEDDPLQPSPDLPIDAATPDDPEDDERGARAGDAGIRTPARPLPDAGRSSPDAGSTSADVDRTPADAAVVRTRSDGSVGPSPSPSGASAGDASIDAGTGGDGAPACEALSCSEATACQRPQGVDAPVCYPTLCALDRVGLCVAEGADGSGRAGIIDDVNTTFDFGVRADGRENNWNSRARYVAYVSKVRNAESACLFPEQNYQGEPIIVPFGQTVALEAGFGQSNGWSDTEPCASAIARMAAAETR